MEYRGYEVMSYAAPFLCPLYLLDGSCQCPTQRACCDIIITDLRMPKLSGLEFIGNQKKKNARFRTLQ
jgi:CheY-like chemotaxis protein